MSKTILITITGASSGIGRASTALFAVKGWNVVATMRHPDASLEADNLLVEKLDVQDVDSIQHAVDAGIARFGAIDVLLNNAGYGQYGLFEALSRGRHPDAVRRQRVRRDERHARGPAAFSGAQVRCDRERRVGGGHFHACR